MNTLATIVFWIVSAAAAGALAITYHRGWRAVAIAIEEFETARASELAPPAPEAEVETSRTTACCAAA